MHTYKHIHTLRIIMIIRGNWAGKVYRGPHLTSGFTEGSFYFMVAQGRCEFSRNHISHFGLWSLCGQLVLGSMRCSASGQQESRNSQSSVQLITRKWYSGVLWITAEVIAYRHSDYTFHARRVPHQCAYWNTNSVWDWLQRCCKYSTLKLFWKEDSLEKNRKPPNCAKSNLI